MAAYGTGNQPAAAVPTGGVAGWGTWNLPNFVGELFKLSPLDTPLLSMVGGLSGGASVASPQFTWQDTIHRAPALTATGRKAIEGADASFSVQSRTERQNVCEIFQYGVELTYTKQAATGLLGTSGATPDVTSESILGTQPVQNEMAWQLQIKLEQAALDVEVSFLTGTFAYPADGTARQTQGLVGAITTVSLDALAEADWSVAAGAAVTGRILANEVAVAQYNNGARLAGRNTIMLGASEKLALSSSFSNTGALEPRSRTEFGVSITAIETDVARYDIVLNRHLAAGTVLFLNLDVIRPRFLPIPGKGHFFLEPLSKAGSYDRMQLYGEIGLEYGPQGWHAKVIDFDGTTVTA